MIKKLFISKNDSELSDLQSFCLEKGIALTAKSFLQFESKYFSIERNFDIIFFSSPRSVLFFNSQYSIPSTTEIACIGDKTKTVLESLGKKVAFIGSSSSPSEVAEKFKKWCGDRIVLFPLSNISKKSVSKHLNKKQKIEVEAYITRIITSTVTKQDCYVFTSPSNVSGFFDSINETAGATVIAWGETTAGELEKRGIKPLTLRQPSIQELIDVIQTL